MKRFLLIALTTLSIHAIAQTNTFPSSGNVGIGTTNPQAKLSVLGGIAKLTTIGIDGTFDNIIKYGHQSDLESSTTYANRWHGIDATITAGDAASNKLKFRLYGGGYGNEIPKDVMTLLGNGNVGIGTSSPNEKLEIEGNLRISNGENCSIFPTGHSLTFGGRQDYAHVSYIFRPSWGTPSSTYSNFQLQNATNNGVFTTAVMLTTDGGSSYINSGNVGIGTSNPAYKLDVLGTIRAKEVLVNLDGGADFVFEKGYKLLPIEHVANYVQENKHLPDIPSANDMVKNGVSMGDMQVKLLQKVEELTLYAIQQNKKIETLEKRINELETK